MAVRQVVEDRRTDAQVIEEWQGKAEARLAALLDRIFAGDRQVASPMEEAARLIEELSRAREGVIGWRIELADLRALEDEGGANVNTGR